MSGGILGIATSGLISFQRSLQTVSHNITNANTEGYSRQRVDLAGRPPSFTGAGFLGNGVEVGAVSRNFDGFLTQQVRSNTTAHAQSETYARLATQVDRFIADDAINLGNTLQDFFNAVQNVATDPTSIAGRQSMLGEAASLINRFQAVNGRFDEIRKEVISNLSDRVSQINSAASSIAQLNDEIAVASARSNTPPNDLLDQRDTLILELAKKVGVNVISQSNGVVDVSIGNGQSLVLGGSANKLVVQSSQFNEPGDVDIAIVFSAGTIPITGSLSGGELGGVLNFRDQMLNTSQNAIGRIAAGLVTDFNAQHLNGHDLNGAVGTNFFTPLSAVTTFAKTNNASSIQATIANPSQLTVNDYQLNIIGASYQLLDSATGTLVASGAATNPIDLTTTTPAFGLILNVTSGALTSGDSFMVRANRAVAGSLNLAISDPRLIAAAGADPTLTISNGNGDNSNAKALAALQKTPALIGGTASYQDAFGALVSTVGTNTRTNQTNSDAQKRLLDHSMEAREQLSGVNLDEEAANLVQFQQAYQASAQLVAEVKSMFDALMGAVRR